MQQGGAALAHQRSVDYTLKFVIVGDSAVGKSSLVRCTPEGILDGFPAEFIAGRYHSLYAVPEKLPECFRVMARTEDGVIMAIEHRELPLAAVQFHPESILTLKDDLGLRLIAQVIGQLAR